VGSEIHAVGSGQDIPNVVKLAVGLGHARQQRDEFRLSRRISRQISESAAAADINGAARIDCQGAGELAVNGDFAPRNAFVVGDEDESAKILYDRPALLVRAVIGGRVGVDEKRAGFRAEAGARWNKK
jgi:hypothetical protein